MTVWMSFATADAMVKMPPASIAIVSGHFLPRSSDQGAQNSGPDANPSTYSVVPNFPTSDPTPNSLLMLSEPGAKMALVRATMKVPEQTRVDMTSLVHQLVFALTFCPMHVLGRGLPVVGMYRVVNSIEIDQIMSRVGKRGWKWLVYSNGDLLSHCNQCSGHVDHVVDVLGGALF